MQSNIILAALVILAGVPALQAEETKLVDGWPPEVRVVRFLSPADNTMQPALFYNPAKPEPVPLLVALHPWSANYLRKEPDYAVWCIKKGWAMIHPDFRGRFNRPEATGSESVVQDILAAVEYARKQAQIDSDRIYLVGVSGGGYISLLMAGRHPEIWAGVSAWVPIYDLKDWHAECATRKAHYARQLEKSCGGAPGTSAEVDRQYRVRSASTYLTNAAAISLDINAGIRDGSVPVSQSLKAFNALAKPEDRISADDIGFIADKAEIPGKFPASVPDSLYGRRSVLLRRISNNARVTIFNGEHEIIPAAGLAWLEKQRKNSAPVWDVNSSANRTGTGNPQN